MIALVKWWLRAWGFLRTAEKPKVVLPQPHRYHA